jgi:hypothetical protein
MTPLEQIAQALEHARPHVKGAALEREVGEALEVARGLVREERATGQAKADILTLEAEVFNGVPWEAGR